jgi:hypothetical protein
MEYASQASFLEKLRTEGEILWTYFVRDGKTANGGEAARAGRLLPSSWRRGAIYLRDPAHFGFADILATLPPPVVTSTSCRSPTPSAR